MAKAHTTPRATRAQRAALAAAGLASTNSEKETRLRRWACKIVSDLPAGAGDAQRTLDLAGELLRGWASKGGRAAR